MTAKKARRDSWKTEPLPAKHKRLDVHRRFTAAEYRRLCRGLIPEAMEDKWFIFEEDGWLNFHRSWTGYCIYQVRLEEDDSGCAATEVRVNHDPEQYTEEDDRTDLGILAFLIDGLLLGRDVGLPELSSDGKDGLDPIRQWGLFGRASIGQGPGNEQDEESGEDDRPPQGEMQD